MTIAVVQFPGSNCERETMLAVQRAGMIPVEFLWNEPHAKLRDMDGYIIVGGFSYEDRSRSGVIAALDPVMNEIKNQSEQGKPVLGICNGAQILVETGLVPGLKNKQVGMALTENKRMVDGKILGTGFYNTWINMRLCANVQKNAFTRHLSKDSVLSVPIAHAEGRFVMPMELVNELLQEGLNLFQYCDDQGNVLNHFPVNPNGSVDNIAAVLNKAGNVLAMMPHPERTTAGDALFLSMRDYILEGKKYQPSHLSYTAKPSLPIPYAPKMGSHEFIVQLIITDNHALTVQTTLRQLGIPVSVSRMVHWQVDCNAAATIEQIKQSGLLYNERKEFLVSAQDIKNASALAYLVQSKDDLLGQQKLQMLQDHFAITGVSAIHHGILWIFKSDVLAISDLKDAILNTHIISNPYAHTSYDYYE
ncbi:MAG: phosphoribosylformylglycinamidine synthase I [Legionellales bacterium]